MNTHRSLWDTHTETQLFTAHTHTHISMPTRRNAYYMRTHTYKKKTAWQKCVQNWTAPFVHAHTHIHIQSDEWVPGDRLHMHSGVRFYTEKLINNDNGVSGSHLPAHCSTCCNLPCMITPESWGAVGTPFLIN